MLQQLPDHKVPPMQGLVLAGGQSSRMGQDKGMIKWHGKAQRYHVADLLQEFCPAVYISCRQEQQAGIDAGYRPLPDHQNDLGPISGLMAAFQQKPDCAWLVVACDLPLINAGALGHLIGQRNSKLLATAYENPWDSLPEPLLTIWEPAALPVLQAALSDGKSSLRKVLMQHDIALIRPLELHTLMNANTEQEAARIRASYFKPL